MIRIHLDETTREELQGLRRQVLPGRVRDRLEMVLLSVRRWLVRPAHRRPPRLPPPHHTARAAIKGFLQEGTASLWPDKPGPTPDQARRDRVTALLRELLGQERTWTSQQLADALPPHGVGLSARQVRRYLKLMKAGYRRTASMREHKQDPAKVARAEATRDSLKKVQAGKLRLFYLDESGFAPSLPLGYSWCLPSQRKRVKYEVPAGPARQRAGGVRALRRVAVAGRPAVGADAQLGRPAGLPAPASAGSWCAAGGGAGQRQHAHQQGVQGAPEGAGGRGICLYYLPPYSPVFKQVKHHEISKRSHTSRADLGESVRQGFDSYASRLRPKCHQQSRPAA